MVQYRTISPPLEVRLLAQLCCFVRTLANIVHLGWDATILNARVGIGDSTLKRTGQIDMEKRSVQAMHDRNLGVRVVGLVSVAARQALLNAVTAACARAVGRNLSVSLAF
jgi:hypothetical protein